MNQRQPKWVEFKSGMKAVYGTQEVTLISTIDLKDGTRLIEYEDKQGVRRAAFPGSFEPIDPFKMSKMRYKKLDVGQKARLRSFVKDLHDVLESSIDNKTYLIRKATKTRGGSRLIIHDPYNPKRGLRHRIWRGEVIQDLIERAVSEAFGKIGFKYYEEYLQQGGFKKMKNIRKRQKPKPKQKGVRRKKINEKGPMVPVCAWGENEDERTGGKTLVCVQRLKTKREFEHGLCSVHIELRKTFDKRKLKRKKEELKMAKKVKKEKEATKKAKKADKAEKSGGGGRRGIPIQGFPATAWIRTVGAKDYSVEQVIKAAQKFAEGSKKPKEVTIKLNYRLRHNTDLPIAELTNKHWKEIRDYVGKPEGNKKPEKKSTKEKAAKKTNKKTTKKPAKKAVKKAVKKAIKKRKVVKKKK